MMLSTTEAYSIGGVCVAVEYDRTEAARVLREELRSYPVQTSDPDLTIRMCSYAGGTRSTNPRTHREHDNGFSADIAHTAVTWVYEEGKPVAYFDVGGRVKSYRSKLRGMQYTHPYEEAGQLFHEACLIPALALFFYQRIVPLHASSFEAPGGAGVLVVGTGGVGKTTSELELIRANGFRFLADDISLISGDGRLYPNFAYPKIYGYNVQSDVELRSSMFDNRRIGDKLWWRVQTRIRSSNRIRRRVDPRQFYDGKISHGAALEVAIFLMKADVADIVVRDLSADRAAEMSMAVLETELRVLWNHLAWHRFNRPPAELVWNDRALVEHWFHTKSAVFANARCVTVTLPTHSSADTVRGSIPTIVRDLLTQQGSVS